MDTFAISPLTNLSEEVKRLLAVTSFKATNSVSNITDENKTFSSTMPSHWTQEAAENTVKKLKIL